jgi:hypothetical protein
MPTYGELTYQKMLGLNYTATEASNLAGTEDIECIANVDSNTII